jgi:uncharacterized protein (DUF488 family)
MRTPSAQRKLFGRLALRYPRAIRIRRLIDVRSNPTARRYGFHESTLDRLVNRLSIEYRHFAELGIRSEIRRL